MLLPLATGHRTSQLQQSLINGARIQGNMKAKWFPQYIPRPPKQLVNLALQQGRAHVLLSLRLRFQKNSASAQFAPVEPGADFLLPSHTRNGPVPSAADNPKHVTWLGGFLGLCLGTDCTQTLLFLQLSVKPNSWARNASRVFVASLGLNSTSFSLLNCLVLGIQRNEKLLALLWLFALMPIMLNAFQHLTPRCLMKNVYHYMLTK